MTVTWKISDNKLFEITSDLVGRTIHLVTPKEFEDSANGTVFHSIFGEKLIKGEGKPIDLDTRGGYCAFGILQPWN